MDYDHFDPTDIDAGREIKHGYILALHLRLLAECIQPNVDRLPFAILQLVLACMQLVPVLRIDQLLGQLIWVPVLLCYAAVQSDYVQVTYALGFQILGSYRPCFCPMDTSSSYFWCLYVFVRCFYYPLPSPAGSPHIQGAPTVHYIPVATGRMLRYD